MIDFKNAPLLKKLNLSFSAIIILVSILAIYSVISAFTLKYMFDKYTDLAHQSVYLSEKNEKVTEAAFDIIEFRLLGDPKYIELAYKNLNEVEAAITEVETYSNDPESIKIMQHLHEELKEVGESFKQAIALQEQRHLLINDMMKKGLDVRKKITYIMEKIYQETDSQAAYFAGRTQESFMLARYYTQTYLITNDEADTTRAYKEIDTALERNEQLKESLENSAHFQTADEISKILKAYKYDIEEVEFIISERNKFYSNIDVILPQVMAEYDLLVNKAVEIQNALGPKTRQKITISLIINVFVGLLTIGLTLWLSSSIRKNVNETMQSFIQKLEMIIGSLQSVSQNVSVSAEQTSQAMEQTNTQCSNVASASEETSSNVQTVAAASEELTASIQEITRNVTDTSTMAQKCSESALKSQEQLDVLRDSIMSIENVVAAINDVAEQTNLLALNATIEAARAGEAGKSFAVVANEVKSLANETNKMTLEIGENIDGVKSTALEVIEAMKSVIQDIQSVDEQTASVSASVEQQNASTAEISRNAQQAAKGTEHVSKSVIDIRSAAEQTHQSVQEMKVASSLLEQESTVLERAMTDFKKQIGA